MDARVSLRAACIGLLLTIPVAGQPQQAEQQETPRRDQTRQPARDAQRQQQPPAKPGSEAGKDQALSARQTFSGNVEHGRYLADDRQLIGTDRRDAGPTANKADCCYHRSDVNGHP